MTESGARVRRPGRPRAGEERLSRDRILAAAARLVEAEGLAALSMRRLGAALGVDPMSIYHHLPGKEAVIAGLIARAFATMPAPPAPDLPWQERVRAWAAGYIAVARAHPNLVMRLVTDAAAVSDAMLQISEPLYAALWAAGLPPRQLALAAGTVVDYVHGHVLPVATEPAARTRVPRGDAELVALIATRVAALPADQAPTMRQVFAALTSEAAGPATTFTFDAGLDLLIRGIEAVASEAQR